MLSVSYTCISFGCRRLSPADAVAAAVGAGGAGAGAQQCQRRVGSVAGIRAAERWQSLIVNHRIAQWCGSAIVFEDGSGGVSCEDPSFIKVS